MERKREPAIDRFRGAAILLMVLADYLGGVHAIPAFLKHAPDIGFTTPDAVAPMFIFAIGLTFKPSFEKRFAQDKLKAYMHVIVRYFAILGIGALFSAGGTAVAGQPTAWGVLQAIGVAGLLCLVFIRLKAPLRIAIGLLLLCLYQFALDRWLLTSILSVSHGGFFGAVSWGAMLIIATGIADYFRKGFKSYGLVCIIFAALAVISAFFVPVSKNRVSMSYVLVTLALSGVVFLVFDRASARMKSASGFFVWWGENPLALYILHLFVLGLIELPFPASFYAGAPFWLAVVQLVVVVGVISAVAWWLHQRKIRISL